MNIEFLKMFIDVGKYRSITKASEEGLISQSALSQQIQSIEKQLNARLFDRSSKGVELTEAGKIVYKYAEVITKASDRMQDELLTFQSKTKKLRILATPIICSHALPCTLYHIKTRFPSYTVEIQELSSKAIEESVLQEACDIGIIAGEPENKALTYSKVCSDPFHIAAGINMNIPQPLSYEELHQFPVIMLSKAQKTQTLLDNYFLQKGIEVSGLNILYELATMESIKISVIQEYGIAFLPYMSMKKELYSKQLKTIDLTNFDFECSYYLIKKKSNCMHSEHIKIIRYIEKIIQQTFC